MKTMYKFLIAAFVCSVSFASCSKKGGTVSPPVNTTTLPAPINDLISAAVLDSMQAHGVVINKGTTPPIVSGIFLLHPYVCKFDNSPGNYAGQTFDDYKYKYSNQDNTKFTIRVDYLDTQYPGEIDSDTTNTFVSGNGKLFTIFSEFNVLRKGINFVLLDVSSGEVSSAGIKNFQDATYIVSKDPDPNHYVEPQGAIRIFYDSDYLSETQTIFSQM